MPGLDMMENSNDRYPDGGSALAIEDLHKSFGPLKVLKGVSANAGDSDVLSIIGASGSGKSTMLRCINLLEMPNAGSIWVGGELIRMKNAGRKGLVPESARQVDRIRSTIGMVFQGFNLWTHMTVMQNLTEAPLHVLKLSKAEARERAEALLERVGLTEKREHYPAHLSGGQQQRAAIARALAMEPQLMLFDEPTSALDPELVGEVLKVIHDIAEEGRTMIMVTHEMAFAREVSTKVIFLHDGLVEEEGPPAQVFDAPHSERCQQFLAAGRFEAQKP